MSRQRFSVARLIESSRRVRYVLKKACEERNGVGLCFLGEDVALVAVGVRVGVFVWMGSGFKRVEVEVMLGVGVILSIPFSNAEKLKKVGG